MFSKKIVLAAALVTVVALAACQQPTKSPPSGGAQLPNPASVYCADQGYTLEMREGEGGQYGVCIFPDGTECDEWAFMRGECGVEWSYCAQQGYTLEVRDGVATCVFDDGSACAEIDYFNGDCAPGSK